jgi:hypothetical protein
MPTFLIENNNRDDNLGDQVISRDLCTLLSRFGNVYISGSPKPYHDVKQIPFDISRSLLRRTLSALIGHRYYRVFPAGGWGQIRNSHQIRNSQQSTGSSRRICSRVRRFLKKKVELRDMALGVSLEIHPQASCLDNYFLVGVRDNHSLQSISARRDVNGRYFPDLSFFGPCNPVANQPRQNNWAVSFRTKSPDLNGDLAIDACVRAINEAQAVSDETNVLFYFQVNEDKDSNRHLSGGCKKSVFLENKLTLETYQSFYQQTKVVVSNRLHCLLLGAINGAVPVAMVREAHWKVVEFFRTVGWHDLLVLIDSPPSMAEKLHRISTDYIHYRDFVQRTCEDQRALGIQLLTSLIGPQKRISHDYTVSSGDLTEASWRNQWIK